MSTPDLASAPRQPRSSPQRGARRPMLHGCVDRVGRRPGGVAARRPRGGAHAGRDAARRRTRREHGRAGRGRLAVLERHGARSAPALVYGFPGAICISVNDEAVHGVPGRAGSRRATSSRSTSRPSSAATWRTPRSRWPSALLAARRTARGDGGDGALGGHRRGACGLSAQCHRPRRGPRRGRCRLHRAAPAPGHGIGRTIHEPPDVLNYDEPRNRGRLTPGLVITIEPIITARGEALSQDADGWTVRTRDGSLTAHAEHTWSSRAGDRRSC